MRAILFALTGLAAMGLALTLMPGCATRTTTVTQTGAGPVTTSTTTSSNASAAMTAGLSALGALLVSLNTDVLELIGVHPTTAKTPPSGTTSAGAP